MFGRQRFEQRRSIFRSLPVAAIHEAIAVLEPPHAAAGATIEVMNAMRFCPLGTHLRIPPVGVPSIDDDILFIQQR